MDGEEIAAVADSLRRAVHDCATRGLRNSARWAAEVLSDLKQVHVAAQSAGPLLLEEEDLYWEEHDEYLQARLYFDDAEYRRCASLLRDAKSCKGLFLRRYARYLAGEERAQQEQAERHAGSLAGVSVENRELSQLLGDLLGDSARLKMDAFHMYLLGIVQRRTGEARQAAESLCSALIEYPVMWCAWLELASLVTQESISLDSIPQWEQYWRGMPHWTRQFFLAHLHTELQDPVRALDSLDSICAEPTPVESADEADESTLVMESLFHPASLTVLHQKALSFYAQLDLESATECFEEIMAHDPFCMKGMDCFSNILYVKGERSRLSRLAHTCHTNRKFCPETCCVVANYYSLRGQHAKAVVYLRRALQMDPTYLSAWTLMGHEYIELKNLGAAIYGYRKAVDINQRDFRAWYGLGQTYEMIHMPLYALFYYRKATTIRPEDSRMWCALGKCYESQLRFGEALECYRRAHPISRAEEEQEFERGTATSLSFGGDKSSDAALPSQYDPLALRKQGELYRQLNDRDSAAVCYRRLVAIQKVLNEEEQMDAGVLLFLAHYYKSVEEFEAAEHYCSHLLDLGGPEKEEAKALLRDMRSTAYTEASVERSRTDAPRVMEDPELHGL